MKQLIYILILLASTATSILAQPLTDNKRDYIWLFGMRNQLYNAGDTSYGGAYMDFKTNPPLLYKQPKRMNFSIGSSSLCDSLGNLFAYSNGISIADRTHQTMMNGDSIGYDPNFWELYENRGLPSTGFFMVSRLSKVYLFYLKVINFVNAPTGSNAELNYALIDEESSSGQGKVVKKDITLTSDSLTVPSFTVKHANGKDWWLLYFKENNQAVSYILSDSIEFSQVQNFPVTEVLGGASARAVSSNGTKIGISYINDFQFYNNPLNKVVLYDYDRCSGNLTNQRVIHTPLGVPAMGLTFSPNSNLLYVCSFDYIFQYDMTLPTAAEIEASVDTVAVYDGFKHLGQYETKFFLPQNAPDGKIYMSTWYGKNRYMHVIEDPNERGMACHVRQHELWLPSWSEMTMPNFPNYRLGAIDGSACDTLGIDQQTFPLLRLKPYKVNFGEVEIGQTYSRTIKAYNLGTGTVLPTTFTTQTGDYSLTLPTAISVGDSTTLTLTYTPSAASIGAKDTLRIESNSQIPTNLIFARADVNTATEDIDSNTPSILVYPNPAQESITLSYELAQDGEAELVNSLGQVIATHALQAGYHKTWFSVADVPNGAYFIRVSTSAGVQISKQVFVLH